MRLLSNSINIRGAVFGVVVVCLFCSAAYGQPWDGNGVEGDPYLIYTPAQMNTIGAMLLDYDKHFRLMADIDLSAYTGTSFFIIGMYPDYPFTGVFDGNGHTISNFTYTSTATDKIGLFGYVDGPGAEIKNLGVINPDVDAGTGDNIGSLAGQIGEGSISNCYVEGGSVSGDLNVGGLVGYNRGTITNCYSTGRVSGRFRVGGLVGWDVGGRIINCYAKGVSVSGTEGLVGGLVGWNEKGEISDCYATGSVSAPSTYVGSVGGLAGSNGGAISHCYSTASVSVTGINIANTGGLVGGNGGHISNSYATGGVSGVDRVGGLVGYNRYGAVVNCYSTGSVSGTGTGVGGLVGNNNGMVSACFWDKQSSGRGNMCGSVGGSGSGCDDGNGKTTAEMQNINTFMGAGWDFVNQADGPSDDWAEPEAPGYMILWWQLPENELPALPTFSGGTGEANDPYLISTITDLNRIGHNGRLMAAHFRLINDIDLDGVNIFFIGSRGYGYSGVFNGNGHRISNFTYSSTGRNNVGLFGEIAGEDAEVKDLGLIAPNIDAGTGSSIGSLVGWLADGTVSGCYVNGGSVFGDEYIGGLVGYNGYGLITNCRAVDSVSGGSRVGGLVGSNNSGTITHCHSSGIVLGGNSAGGLVGQSRYGTFTDCYSTASVSGGQDIGGLVGYGGTVTNCYATGDVSGDRYVGGLVGFGSHIFNSYATGNVSAINEHAGGLTSVTHHRGTVTNCYATGSVSAPWVVGGLMAENQNGTITNCYATGNVQGDTRVGGLVGWNRSEGTVTNCYSTSYVTGTTEVGGLMGRNQSGTISASFWDIQTSGRSNMCGSQDPNLGSGCDDGNGKTTAEMQDPNTFTSAGWDFFGESTNGTEDIWRLCSAGTNYPKLTWQFPLSDFVCPDGVDWSDLGVLCGEWLFEELSADVAPNGGDGFVNFLDWAIFAEGWQTTHDIFDLAVFADQWLGRVLLADVWPDGSDLFVDFSDWALFADAWQSTPESPNWNRRCDIAPAGGDEIVDMDDIVVFMQQWLTAGSYYRHLGADIAPAADGDGIVNMRDFAALANDWLQ